MTTLPSQAFEDDDIQTLCDVLFALQSPGEIDLRALPDLLNDSRIRELKKLLEVPPKNDANRCKLKEGKLDIDGTVFDLNEIFLQEAIQLSDDFSLDEILAAKYLFRGSELSQRLGRTPSDSAKLLYHTRRRNILDAIRLIAQYAVEDKVVDSLPQDTRRVLGVALENLVNGGNFVDRCISTMATIRESVQQLKDKEKHAQTLRMAMDVRAKDDLGLQLESLWMQHEMLASILSYLVKDRRATVADFRRLLSVFKGLERYDVFVAHVALPAFTFISFICGPESPLSFEETIQLHEEILKDYKENPWTLRYCQAGFLIWWLSEFNGLCNDPPPGNAPSKDTLDYFTDVHDPAKVALKDGGLELIMAMASDIGLESPLNSAKEDLHRFLQTRVSPLEDVGLLTRAFRTLLIGQFELFIDTFIANMATLLQDIKTSEEEDILLNKQTYDRELERFFFIIHYVYQGRPEAGMAFWNDPENNLYGFVQWAARNQTAFMVATFSYMLTSIACGVDCSEATYKFLLDEVVPGSNRSHRRGEPLTWSLIFKRIQVYLTALEARQRGMVSAPGFRPPPPPSEPAEPGPELSMELDGMLRLTSQIAAESTEARHWLNTNPNFNFMTSLFDLLNLQAATQLWDSIFATITALLANREEGFNYKVWAALDNWALGPPPVSSSSLSLTASTAVMKPLAQGASDNLELIISTVHPAEAFTRLLCILVQPPEADLRDALPFPENLGSSNRISGMEPYVDFIIGTVFSNTTAKNLPRNLAVNTEREETISEKLSRVQYRRFRPALQLSCLQFMHACLANFNDDLLDMAHKGIPVDDGIRTSSLLTYAKLHPFGRVMEHILTEKCLNVLFEILQLGWEDLLEKSEPPIAVTDTILYTIMILDLAIELQPTYFRVVRPFIKQDEGIRRSNVVGNSFDKLEKAIHYHLDTVIHLGLYVGAAQPGIVLSAISLLQKFNVSPDMMASTESTFGRQLPMNRVLGVVEHSTESRKIVLNFIEKWELSEDLEGAGNQFSFKMPILKFLDNILAAQPSDYNLAHMLLGFGYDLKEGIQLSVASGGIGSGVSLLHCIMLAALDTRETADGVQYSPSHCEFKNACFRVLSRLWHSPAMSSDVLFILRANKFLFEGFLSETTINSSTLWSNTSIAMTEEFFDRGASAFCDYLQRRTALFEYTALEIRQLTVQGASTMVQRYLSTLLGTTVLPDRGPAANVHILDLLDFLEFHFEETTRAPRIDWLPEASSSLLVFQDENSSKISLFDLRKVAEFLKIKKNSLLKSGALALEQEPLVDNEIANLQQHLFCENQLRQCLSVRLECLRAWAVLVIMMLEDCDMEHKAKTAFVLQALQAILPKLESFSGGDVEAAEVLSALAHSLISHVTFDTATFGKGRGSDLASDRLYQLFRISLRCIQIPLASPRLREDFYNIALKYLNGMAALHVSNPGTRRHDTQTIKASGDRLLEVICNDAYAGDGPRKVVSLLLLEAVAALAVEDDSSYVVDTIVRHNFLVVLVDSIMSIGSDLQNTSAEDIPAAMKAFRAATGFLLRIAQTRAGAEQVINAGLFQALRGCQLFSVDPDLGVGFNDPQALQKYYELLLDIVRVVVACILSRGPQNRQMIDAGKLFLLEARSIAVTVFKRHSGIGGKSIGGLKPLVDLFVLLFALTEEE